MSDAIYFAIGDVHGEADRLAAMYETILAEIDRARMPACIVHLGDLIDRGAESRACIALAMTLHACASETLRVVTLRGNHEQMLLDAYDEADDSGILEHWLRNGGDSTLASYLAHNDGGEEDDWRAAVDLPHVSFLRALPNIAVDEDRGLAFVHAGIDPHNYPNCKDEFRIWTRSPRFFQSETWPDREELEGLTVIHGHTPTRTLCPELTPRRINVDTGAVYGGPLTAVMLAPDQTPRFLTA